MFGNVTSGPSPDEVIRAALDALSAVAALDLDALNDTEVPGRLMAAARLQGMAEAVMVDTVGAFDARLLHVRDGAFSTAGWLAGHTDTSRAKASMTVKVAREARHMPATMTQARDGRLGFDKVRVLAAARGVSETTAKEFDSDEDRLLGEVSTHSVDIGARIMRNWAAAADPDADEASHEDRETKRKVHLSTSLDGMGFLDGLLTAEANAIVDSELESIVNDLHRWGLSRGPDGTRLSAAQIRHDALVEMARRSGASSTIVEVRQQSRERAAQETADQTARENEPVDDTAEPDAPAVRDNGTPNASKTRVDNSPTDTARSGEATDTTQPLHDPPGVDANDDLGPFDPVPPEIGDPGSDTTLDFDFAFGDEPELDIDDRDESVAGLDGLLIPTATGTPGSSPPTDKIGGGLGRPLFHVIVDLDTFEGRSPPDLLTYRAEAIGTGPLPQSSIRRLLCDAGVSRIVTQGASLPLDVGAVSRTATPAMWRALVAHAGGCEIPGCGAPPDWCEAHHLDHWEHDHHTFLWGLILACNGHHHLLHKPGWAAHRRPDGIVVITRPDGTQMIGTHGHGLSSTL